VLGSVNMRDDHLVTILSQAIDPPVFVRRVPSADIDQETRPLR
jgi:hypothetical protein